MKSRRRKKVSAPDAVEPLMQDPHARILVTQDEVSQVRWIRPALQGAIAGHDIM